MSSEFRARSTVTRWVNTMPLVFLLFGISFGTWLSRLPAVRDALSASTLEMSYYALCLAGGSLLGLICSGALVQRLGPRRSMLIGTLLQTISLPLAVFLLVSVSLPAGLACLVLYGVVFAIGDVAMNVSGAEAEREYGRPRMPLMHAGYSTGTVIAMAVGAGAEALRVPVLWHVVLMCLIIAVSILILLRNVPKDHLSVTAHSINDATGPIPVVTGMQGHQPAYTPVTGQITLPNLNEQQPRQPRPPQRKHRSPWRSTQVLLLGTIALSAGVIDGTASDWLPLALVDGRGVTNSVGTLMLGIFFAAIMTARIAGSAILGRFGRVLTLRASAVLAAIGLIIVLTVPGTFALIVGTIIWGLGSGLGWPVAISAAADRRETAVRDVAAVSALGYGSMLLGPIAFGALGEWIGLLPAFWLLLIFAALLGLLAHHTREPASDRAPQPHSTDQAHPRVSVTG